MNKILSVVVLLVLASFSFSVDAQNKKHSEKSHAEMRKELREYKLKFLVQEADLKGEVKDGFSKAFNEHFEAQGKLFKEMRRAKKSLESKSVPTEADYAEYQKTEKSIKARQKAADDKYRASLEKILSPSQLFKLQSAEDKFREKMQEMKAKRKAKK